MKLRMKLALAFTIAIIIISVVFAILSILRENTTLKRELKKQGLVLTETLAVEVRGAFILDKFVPAMNYIDTISENEYVIYVMVRDKEGKVRAHSDLKKIGKVIRDPALDVIYSGKTHIGTSKSSEGEDMYDIAVPVTIEGKVVGVAQIGYSLRSLGISTARARSQILATMSGGIVFGILFALLFAKLLTKPITKLRDVTIEIGKGKLDTQIAIDSKDEIGELVASLRKMTAELNYIAYYDILTGLPNRELYIDRLTQWLARAEFSKRSTAVLSIDIDRFNFINDTFGHDIGDKVLKEVAKKLSASTREGDTVARLGGDTFGIALIDIAASEDIILVVEEIMKNVCQSMKFDEKEMMLTISIGISIYPYDGKDTHELMKNADLALSNAKTQGMKNYQFHTKEMNVRASKFVLMGNRLFTALKNEEFVLYYQPYWEINTKRIVGMEALIRWKSKELGLVSPAKFIPVLEETGMIIEVGEWVFRTACKQIKEWQDKGYSVIPMSVNISVNVSLVQFRQKYLVEIVEGIIKESGLDPKLLTIELTESAFMQDIEFTNSVLRKLKDIGVAISIDDFGTGYSSLSYLKRFPVDNLKIDISFIKDVATDLDTASIVTAIIAMAHSLNLKTIAEGVETEEQWEKLRFLGCDMGQGYFYSPPLPAEDAEKLIYQR